MDDYGSNAALGFIQGSIIGEGISQATNAYRRGLAARREFMELEQDYGSLRAQYLNLRNHALDLEIALRNKDSQVAIGEAEIARGKHEIALRDHEIALRNHEIAKRDYDTAMLEKKLLEAEITLRRERDSKAVIAKVRDNLKYAYKHYRRLLQIPQNGGDAYDYAGDSSWSPDQVPPDQRSENLT